MKLKIAIFSMCALFFATQVQAQQHQSKHSTLQIELLGAYNLAGISFDRRFTESQDGLGYKVGIGVGYSKNSWKFVPFKFDTWGGFPNQTIVSLPLQLNYLSGKKNHQFEAGAGITPFYSTYQFSGKGNINAYGAISAGYRYHSPSKRIVLGTGLMLGCKLPGLTLKYVDKIFWQPYLSIGYLLD